MLDLKFIRENAEAVVAGIRSKGDTINIDEILNLDGRRRELLQNVEKLKADRNQFSQQVSQLKKEKKDATAIIERTREIGQEIKQFDDELRDIETSLEDHLLRIPNLPHSSVPKGKDASENVEVKKWGEIPEFSFCNLLDAVGLFGLQRAPISVTRLRDGRRETFSLDRAPPGP